jgi:hypothetical protein
MTEGLSERNALLMTDMNWQLQNGLTYFGQYVRPEVLHTWLPDVLLYAPALMHDNRAIGREIIATERAANQITAAYGPLFKSERTRAVPTLENVVGTLPAGTRYVLCVLKPAGEFVIDYGDLDRAIRRLTGGGAPTIRSQDYVVLAGRAGTAPVLFQASNDPFRRRVRLDGVAVDVRMESWLAFDTIRRMGFGHVIANRHHSLIVERGISLVTLDDDGRPLRTAYAAGIFAPQPRYVMLSSK